MIRRPLNILLNLALTGQMLPAFAADSSDLNFKVYSPQAKSEAKGSSDTTWSENTTGDSASASTTSAGAAPGTDTVKVDSSVAPKGAEEAPKAAEETPKAAEETPKADGG